MSELTRELLATAANGKALEALAVCLTHDRHGADDLLQDAYLAFLQSPKRIEPPAIPWLAAAMRLLARRRRRTDRNRVRREIAAAHAEASDSDAADAPLLRFERKRMIVDHVASLDPSDREIIILRFFEGQSSQQIARRLAISDGAARTRLSRALDALRKRLDHTHGGDRAVWRSALLPLVAGGPIASGGTLGVLAMKVKSKVVAAAALILLVSIGGYLFWDSSFVDDALSSEEADEDPSAAEAIRRRPIPESAAAAVEEGTASRLIARNEDASAASRPVRSGQRMTIFVIDHRTGEKVADAEVFLIPKDSEGSMRRDDLESPATSDRSFRRRFAETFGRKFRTGKDGRAKLLGWRLGDQVDVFHGKRTGTAGKVYLGSSELTVTIAEPRMLSVVCRRTDGSPARDCPLMLLSQSLGLDRDTTPSFGMTDASGRAFLPLLPVPGSGEIVGRLSFGIPGVAGPVREFDPDELPNDDVLLTLPALCDLRCEVFGQNGEPVSEGTVAIGPHRVAPISGGVAVVRGVGTDADIVGEVRVAGRPPTTFRVSERRLPDSTHSVRIRLEGRPVTLKARIVDGDGRPISSAMFRIETKDENDRVAFGAATYSDEAGRIEWIHLDHGSKVSLEIRNYSLRVPPGKSVPFDVRPEVQSLDLGDVVIEMPKPAFGGVIRSTAGVPIAGATIEYRAFDESVDGSIGFERSDEEGRFAVSSELAEGTEMILTATADGFYDGRPTSAKVGDHRIVLALDEAQRLTGTVLLDAAVDPAAFRVEVRPVGAPKTDEDDGSSNPSVELSRAGQFVVGNLLPGTYDLFVRCGGDRVVASINGVRVGPGIDPDPRLHSIDLSSRFSAMKIVVRSTDGKAVSDAVLRPIRGEHGYGSWRSSVVRAIPLDKENLPEAVVIDADGFFAEAIPAAPGRHEVILEKAVHVNVVFEGELPKSATRSSFGIVIEPAHATSDGLSAAARESLNSARWLGRTLEMSTLPFEVPAESKNTVKFFIDKTVGSTTVREFIGATPAEFTTGSAPMTLTLRLDQ